MQLAAFYDHWADTLAEIAVTDTVVVLCEGDPFLLRLVHASAHPP